ncbi:iron ABC transporter permease [Pseudonocardia ailaonensis]|uniref:Iron ABC transporter permease n=1 Tax=Pseudonocardia ailaonensis TaxID=367279 RepID=A0ABN2NAN1_9PSEU
MTAVDTAPPAPVAIRERRRPRSATLGLVVLVALLGYLVLVPLIQLLVAVAEGGAAAAGNAVAGRGLGSAIVTTVVLTLGSLAIAMVLGVGMAALSVRLPRGWRWTAVLPILPVVAPAVASVTGWAFLFSPRSGYANALLRMVPFVGGDSGPVDVYTAPWIVVITGITLSSFVYVFVRTGMLNLDRGLLEAAQVAGLSPGRAFLRIQLPLLRPVLVYAAGISLLLGLGQFTVPLLLGTASGVEVLATRIYRFTADTPADYAAAALVGSPLLVLGIALVLLQRLALGDQTRFVAHSGKGAWRTSRPVRWAPVPLLVFALVAVVLPLAALVVVALSPFYSARIQPSMFTLANFTRLFRTPFVLDAVMTSLMASIAGALLALVLGYLAATVIHERRWPRTARMLDVLVNLPLGVPAVVYGAGFLYAYSRPPVVLYGTDAVIVVVYLTLMLPYATRSLLGARIALGDDYLAASRVAGAGPLRTHLQIVVPLMRAAIGGAVALMFVLLTHEFTASLLVRSGTTQVMGTKLFDLWSNGSYPQVAAMALVMTGITAAGVVVAMAASGGSNPLERL